MTHSYSHKAHRKKAAKKSVDLPCKAKRWFGSEKEALEAAEYHMLENMRIELGVYHCPACRLWHLTTLQPGELGTNANNDI